MKIDKRNPVHWLCLALFGLNTLLAMALRPLLHRRRIPHTVALYGHKLSGNLLALYRHINAHAADAFLLVFLTMDKRYARLLKAQGVRVTLATRPEAMTLLIRAAAVISDHGLHAMSWLPGRCGIRFFDVWHGIPFKGFDADDFRVQHRYNETWVASPLLANIYVQRYGFDARKVKVTGYARTDRLVRAGADTGVIKRSLGLDRAGVGKIVLFAPTWKQDTQQRSIYPFGIDEQTFFKALAALATRTDSTFVMRAHLNSNTAGNGNGDQWGRIVHRPYSAFPDTEALLLVSDILVCDWSSIAFDYLLLARPTVFLDVEPPFAKGLTLDADYRFGAITDNLQGLLQLLERYLIDPERYKREFSNKCAEIRARVYADYADGNATERCVERLRRDR